jgi:hypothetical protein
MIRSSHRCFRTLLRTSFSLPQKCKPDCLKFRQPCSVVGKWRVDSLKFYFEILSSMSSIVNFTNSSRRQAPLMPKMSTTCIESLLLALFYYPTSTRRHGNFAGVHTLLQIILSSNSAVLINIITGVSPPHFDFVVSYVLCQC